MLHLGNWRAHGHSQHAASAPSFVIMWGRSPVQQGTHSIPAAEGKQAHQQDERLFNAGAAAAASMPLAFTVPGLCGRLHSLAPPTISLHRASIQTSFPAHAVCIWQPSKAEGPLTSLEQQQQTAACRPRYKSTRFATMHAKLQHPHSRVHLIIDASRAPAAAPAWRGPAHSSCCCMAWASLGHRLQPLSTAAAPAAQPSEERAGRAESCETELYWSACAARDPRGGPLLGADPAADDVESKTAAHGVGLITCLQATLVL